MEFGRISLRSDKNVYIEMTPGHFATNHAHINYYVDLTHVKTDQRAARSAAALLAGQYQYTQVDTILCLEGTNIIGAYMAEELTQANQVGLNYGKAIHVLTPELNSNNQMVFRENTRGMVQGKDVVMLFSVVSTGKTINRAFDCLQYYGGRLVGIAAGFSALREYQGIEVNAVFTDKDIAGYQAYAPASCPLCATQPKIDAIVNEYGFSVL